MSLSVKREGFFFSLNLQRSAEQLIFSLALQNALCQPQWILLIVLPVLFQGIRI